MMTLFFTPGACSLAPHILLRELKEDVQLERVSLKNKTLSSGTDYRQINPKGSVPALKIGNGEILTEAAVIMQYLADLQPEMNLIPRVGSFERYRCLEWLNYLSTEIHKGFSPLFALSSLVTHEEAQKEFKEKVKKNLGMRFDYLSSHLKNKTYLLGDSFSIADIYLYVLLGWGQYVELDLGNWPELKSYREKIDGRSSVQEALKAEGLIK